MSEPVAGIEGHGLKVTITDQGTSGGLTTTPADPAGIDLDPDPNLERENCIWIQPKRYFFLIM